MKNSKKRSYKKFKLNLEKTGAIFLLIILFETSALFFLNKDAMNKENFNGELMTEKFLSIFVNVSSGEIPPPFGGGSGRGGGSGGGGGGGGGATPVKCKENWKCLDWSLCKKLNESSEELNNENKNYIQNRCDLFGFDESSCGFRIRFCEDLNRCNILLAKPETIEACDYVYQQNCNDNIKNQNEEGIDCGGDCKPCESPKPVQESKSYWKVGILLSLILLIGVIFFFYRKKNR